MATRVDQTRKATDNGGFTESLEAEAIRLEYFVLAFYQRESERQ